MLTLHLLRPRREPRMNLPTRLATILFVCVLLTGSCKCLWANDATLGSLNAVVVKSELRTVKLYGAGGIAGLDAYQSGFFISEQGHILTVWSTVLDVDEITAVSSDGSRYSAKVIGIDPNLEIAVLLAPLDGPRLRRGCTRPIDQAIVKQSWAPKHDNPDSHLGRKWLLLTGHQIQSGGNAHHDHGHPAAQLKKVLEKAKRRVQNSINNEGFKTRIWSTYIRMPANAPYVIFSLVVGRMIAQDRVEISPFLLCLNLPQFLGNVRPVLEAPTRKPADCSKGFQRMQRFPWIGRRQQNGCR